MIAEIEELKLESNLPNTGWNEFFGIYFIWRMKSA